MCVYLMEMVGLFTKRKKKILLSVFFIHVWPFVQVNCAFMAGSTG